MSLDMILSGVLNGLMAGGIYVLVAIGLTLIYGVLHIINFAHGSLLMLAMYMSFFLWSLVGVDPYAALPIVTVGGFVVGYFGYRYVIGNLSGGDDNRILLITLGLSIFVENAALFFFGSTLRVATLGYADTMIEVGPTFIPLTKIISFVAALVLTALFGLLIARTMLGKAIRAVAKERMGARLSGINVEVMFAVSYGLGIACLGAAACLMIPNFFVSPSSGNAFVIVAFTIVVLGGMGSFVGALVGGMIVGVVESLGGLAFGEQLGQIAIPVIFILILLFRPTGLFRGAQ